jgi:hypothetical protein
MISVKERLEDIPINDQRLIRLDCTQELLTENIDKLAIGGIHFANKDNEDDVGFAKDALVPDIPQQLTVADVQYLIPFLATDQTPTSLRIGLFGTLPNGEEIARRALEEADAEGFKPFSGTLYNLGPYQGLFLGTIDSKPGTRTTITPDPRTKQHSEKQTGRYVGPHYDNGEIKGQDGETKILERFPCSVRADLARRRVIYNAGPGKRKAVVGLTHSALVIADETRPGVIYNVPNTLHLRKFFADNPDEVERAVCLTITLEVGEMILTSAGIAFHDGSMEGCDQESRAIVFSVR